MRLKTAVKLGRGAGVRFIQRQFGNTLFDLQYYRPDLLDQEDVVADDWIIPDQEKISYLDRSLRREL